MQIELRHHFPVSPEKAFEELFSDAYEVASAEQSRLSRTVLVDRSEGGHRVRRVHVVPEHTFPAPVAKLIGQDRFSYVLEERHDLARTRMDWKVVPDALADKVAVQGSWQLSPAPGGCERVVKIEIDVHIPIVGGKIEKQIGADLQASYEQAAQFAQRWLKERA